MTREQQLAALLSEIRRHNSSGLTKDMQHRIDAALSLQADLTQPCRSPYCECDAGKCTHPGFYDARHEPAPAQDEREAAIRNLRCIAKTVLSSEARSSMRADFESAIRLLTRPAQAEQQPYPDFRPQLSAMVKACQRYLDSDGAECFPEDALIEATVALERDAHAASARYAAPIAQTTQGGDV